MKGAKVVVGEMVLCGLFVLNCLRIGDDASRVGSISEPLITPATTNYVVDPGMGDVPRLVEL